MTPLEAEIRRRIREHGPLPVSAYMELCLSHPEHGYYRAREPFGRAGDFVTAPEVSQMFGELLGAWAADTWARMGAPRPVRLVELGPGRGTLMADALRVLARVPDFVAAATLHLVETSPRLARRQAETLRSTVLQPIWHAAAEEVPEGPAIVLANELFDALPVEQWVRTAEGWRARVVTLAADGLTFAVSATVSPERGRVREGVDPGSELRPQSSRGTDPLLASPSAGEGLGRALDQAPVGTVVETSPARTGLARLLARRVAAQGGATLVIDYGHERSATGDTLQAVREHAPADPLSEPGLADLTAHVDFEALGRAGREGGADVHGPMEQGAFLRALGIEHRARRLKAGASASQARAVDEALARLTARQGMGTLFKVMAFSAPGLVPAPFSPSTRIPNA